VAAEDDRHARPRRHRALTASDLGVETMLGPAAWGT